MNIKIKPEIVERLKKRIEETEEFENLEEYVNYILSQVVERLNNEEQDDEEEYSEEDEEKVKERLKSLGYLD